MSNLLFSFFLCMRSLRKNTTIKTIKQRSRIKKRIDVDSAIMNLLLSPFKRNENKIKINRHIIKLKFSIYFSFEFQI